MSDYCLMMLVSLLFVFITGAGLIGGWLVAFIASVSMFAVWFYLEERRNAEKSKWHG